MFKKYPQATLIKAWKEGGFKDGYGITSYQPPSMAKVEAEPEPKVEQLKFNFNEEVTKKSRRNSGKEWRRKKADRES